MRRKNSNQVTSNDTKHIFMSHVAVHIPLLVLELYKEDVPKYLSLSSNRLRIGSLPFSRHTVWRTLPFHQIGSLLHKNLNESFAVVLLV